ncbi:MAG: PT domain-containing protein [Wenzhouxiangellaceae bacterium]|nr:PT domain-containing protein [Wenzhouxiangellaceae bacterium]
MLPLPAAPRSGAFPGDSLPIGAGCASHNNQQTNKPTNQRTNEPTNEPTGQPTRESSLIASPGGRRRGG